MVRIAFLLLTLPLRLILYTWQKALTIHKPFILDIYVRAEYSEAPLVHGFWTYFKPIKDRFYLITLELAAILSSVQKKSIKLRAIRLIIEDNNLGWAQAWEIHSLISKFSGLGIDTSAYLFTESKIATYLASATAKIYAPETMSFDRSPFTRESFYLKNFMSKLGIRPQFISVGDFKSAGEIFTRDKMSAAERNQTEALIRDIETEYSSAVAKKSKAFARLSARDFMVSSSVARKEGFIEDTISFSEFNKLAEKKTKLKVKDVFAINKLIHRQSFKLLPLKRRKKIALVIVNGNIVETAESRPDSVNWPDYQYVSEALQSEEFAAVVVRVNSPGGSALVSQLLWREWMHALGHIKSADENEEKSDAPRKIYVSQGNVAASGGYYLSAFPGKIFATPMTITGSIGVVGGKFNVEPLLTKLGIKSDIAPKKNGPGAFSMTSDFTPTQTQAVRDNMQHVYRQFLRDVATGREVAESKILPHAGGRVFSGASGQKVGLVDNLGGLAEVFNAIKQELKIESTEMLDLIILPEVKDSLWSRSILPFGLKSLVSLIDFGRPRVYALDTRFI